MSFFHHGNNGSRKKALLKHASKDSEKARKEQEALASEDMSMEELDHVSAGGDWMKLEEDNTIICGGDGDIVYSGDGDDVIDGGEGDDQLHGQDGNDTLVGGGGNDALYGGAGNDMLISGDGDDILSGGEGSDTFYIDSASPGTTTITDFTPGEDRIILNGRAGEDFSVAFDPATGHSTITFGDRTIMVENQQLTNEDILVTSTGGADADNVIMAGTYYTNADIRGGGGDDFIQTTAQQSTITGGSGDDTMIGGPGDDTFIFRAGDGNDTVMNFNSGEDSIQLHSIEDGAYTLSFDPATGNSTITYEGGIITILDSELTDGDITVFADGQQNMGRDDLHGTDAGDTMHGGERGDSIDGEAGNDSIYGEGGDDGLRGGAGDDALHGGAGDDGLSGGTGNDTLYGDAGNDVINGDAGDDTLLGGEGDDYLEGGDGHDVLDGGMGNDFIASGSGNDVLTGGEGNDTFYISADTPGTTTITDFDPATDRIILNGQEFENFNFVYDPATGNTIITGTYRTIIIEGENFDYDVAPSPPFDASAILVTTPRTAGDDVLANINPYTHGVIDGGEGNDMLFGQARDDTLKGGAGDDAVYGGGGNDILEGGAGQDWLEGGEGADTYVFGTDDGSDEIFGFNQTEDRLQLLGASSIDDIVVTAANGNTIITYGNSTITLLGVELTTEQVWARVQQ